MSASGPIQGNREAPEDDAGEAPQWSVGAASRTLRIMTPVVRRGSARPMYRAQISQTSPSLQANREHAIILRINRSQDSDVGSVRKRPLADRFP